MPAKPTEDDQYRAAEVVGWEPVNHPELQRALAGRVAQALADERERAVAPFLALADRWTASAAADERAGLPALIHRGTAAWHIRHIAQEPTP